MILPPQWFRIWTHASRHIGHDHALIKQAPRKQLHLSKSSPRTEFFMTGSNLQV